jgi:hypothetical protein
VSKQQRSKLQSRYNFECVARVYVHMCSVVQLLLMSGCHAAIFAASAAVITGMVLADCYLIGTADMRPMPAGQDGRSAAQWPYNCNTAALSCVSFHIAAGVCLIHLDAAATAGACTLPPAAAHCIARCTHLSASLVWKAAEGQAQQASMLLHTCACCVFAFLVHLSTHGPATHQQAALERRMGMTGLAAA